MSLNKEDVVEENNLTRAWCLQLSIFLLGMCLMLLANNVFAGSGVQQELLNMFDSGIQDDRVVSKPVANTKSYMAHADKLLDKQEFKKAHTYYTKVILMDSSIDDAFLGRSIANSGIGRLEDSIADLNVFILRNPYHSMAHVYRGIRYMTQGAHDYAEENLLKAIQLNPRNAQAYDDLGVLYAQQGNIRLALKYFAQTIKIDPYNEMAHHNQAIAYFLIEDNQRALKSVNKAVRLMPESKDTYILKAQILDALGQTEAAVKVRNYAQFLAKGHWIESASID